MIAILHFRFRTGWHKLSIMYIAMYGVIVFKFTKAAITFVILNILKSRKKYDIQEALLYKGSHMALIVIVKVVLKDVVKVVNIQLTTQGVWHIFALT